MNSIKDILRNTKRIISSERKIQFTVKALRAKMTAAELCQKYSINESQFYKWNKDFLEAGKKWLRGYTMKEGSYPWWNFSSWKKNQRLKEMDAELILWKQFLFKVLSTQNTRKGYFFVTLNIEKVTLHITYFSLSDFNNWILSGVEIAITCRAF